VRSIRDLQEFTPSPGSLGKSITIGDFARDILLDQVSSLPGCMHAPQRRVWAPPA
jgi:hypothetical protein